MVSKVIMSSLQPRTASTCTIWDRDAIYELMFASKFIISLKVAFNLRQKGSWTWIELELHTTTDDLLLLFIRKCRWRQMWRVAVRGIWYTITFLKIGPFSAALSFFRLFTTVDTRLANVYYKHSLMTGFEPWTSGVRSNHCRTRIVGVEGEHADHFTTTTAPRYYCLFLEFIIEL